MFENLMYEWHWIGKEEVSVTNSVSKHKNRKFKWEWKKKIVKQVCNCVTEKTVNENMPEKHEN